MQNQEDVHRADGGAGIAQRHHAGAGDKGGGAEVFTVIHAVVRHVGRGQHFKALGMRAPIEFAAVDDGAADAVAVAVDVFGERFHHDVGTQFNWAAQGGRGDGVVHYQRQALRVCGGGKSGNVHHVDSGVADAFAVNQFGARVGVGGDLFGLGWVDKTHFDALLGQGVGEQVVGAAIQGFGGDDVVARFGQSLHGIGNRRHAAGHA